MHLLLKRPSLWNFCIAVLELGKYGDYIHACKWDWDEEDGKTDNSTAKINLDINVPLLCLNAFHLISLNPKGLLQGKVTLNIFHALL